MTCSTISYEMGDGGLASEQRIVASPQIEIVFIKMDVKLKTKPCLCSLITIAVTILLIFYRNHCDTISFYFTPIFGSESYSLPGDIWYVEYVGCHVVDRLQYLTS